jgi:hypothetical protein
VKKIQKQFLFKFHTTYRISLVAGRDALKKKSAIYSKFFQKTILYELTVIIFSCKSKTKMQHTETHCLENAPMYS